MGTAAGLPLAMRQEHVVTMHFFLLLLLQSTAGSGEDAATTSTLAVRYTDNYIIIIVSNY